MCIALLSTSHPKYPFILLNNRDEFLSRPTLHADWWEPPNSHVLGGRDAQRAERGTWLGISRQGRIAILTNFREEGADVARDKSRGAIPSAWLAGSDQVSAESFASRLINETGIDDVGGFSLLFGLLRKPGSDESRPGLRVLSNRSASAQDLKTIATKQGEAHGLSNSHFGDVTWPKVVHGERLLEQAIKGNVARGTDDIDMFIAGLFDVLSVDMLRQREVGESWEVYVRQMRNSILIPPLKGRPEAESGTEKARGGINGATTPQSNGGVGAPAGYGTQKQTVVLVDAEGHVTFVERTLYDEKGGPVEEGKSERRFELDIEGWDTWQ